MLRKIFKWILWLIAIIIFLNIIGYFAIHNSSVQTYLTKVAAKYIKKELNMDVEIERVDLRPFNKILLENLLIFDHQGDTVIYSKKLYTELINIQDFGDKLKLKNIQFEDAFVQMKTHEGDTFSGLDWFIDQVDGESNPLDTNPSTYIVDLKQISFKNSRFNVVDTGLFIGFDIKNLDIKNLSWQNDSLFIDIKPSKVNIDDLLNIESIEGQYTLLGVEEMRAENFSIALAHSKFDGNARIKFHDDQMDWFHKKTQYTCDINELVYDKTDINYALINEVIPNFPIKLRGNLKGTPKKMNFKNIQFTSNKSFGTLEGKIKYLFNPEKIHLDLDFKKLEADAQVVNFYFQDSPEIQKQLQPLFPIKYQGKYKGNFDLNESKGNFSTAIGDLSTDLQILIDPDKNNALYFAQLDFKNFQLDALFPENELGKTSAFFDIKGEGLQHKDLKINIQSTIQEFPFKNYPYKGINLEGKISYNHYEGKLNLIDSNLTLDFNGLIDLNKGKEQFNFNADIRNAKLNRLKLTESPNILSTHVRANVKGYDLDKSAGEVTISNTKYTNQIGSYSLDSILISNEIDSLQNRTLKMQSEILDFDMNGNFELGNIYTELLQKLQPYLDFGLTTSDTLISDQKYQLALTLKDASFIDKLILPNTFLSKNTKLNIHKEGTELPIMDIHSKYLIFGKNLINDISIKNVFNQDTLSFEISSEGIDIGQESVIIDGIRAKFDAKQNQILSNATWEALYDSTNYSGNMNISGNIDTNGNFFGKVLANSYLYMIDKKWRIDSTNSITYDTGKLQVTNLFFKHGKQELEINSRMDFDRENQLALEIENFDLDNINPYLENLSTDLKGRIFGTVVVDDLLDKIKIRNSIIVDSLSVNNLWLGDLIFENKKSQTSGRLEYIIDLEKSNYKIISANASYAPEQGFSSMELNADIKKLRVDFLNPYLEPYLDQMRGRIDGNLQIVNGKTLGYVSPLKVTFQVPLAGTRFSIDGRPKIKLDDSQININNLKLNVERILAKEEGNQKKDFGNTFISGTVFHDNFENFTYNLNANFDKFLGLATTKKDNDIFFGDAVVSGKMKMTGQGASPYIKVDVESQEGTDISIHTTDDNEIEQTSFITFTQKPKEKEKEENILLKTIRKEMSDEEGGFKVDLIMKVKPSSIVRFAMDESIVVSKGFGDMRLNLFSDMSFDLYGSYEVDEADFFYAFTDNLITKKFKIEKGGKITWNGDVFKGQMSNINALYETDLNLKNLGEEDEESKTVQATIKLGGELMKPEVKFGIAIPEASDKAKASLNEMTNTEDKLAKQFISLLLLNSFFVNNQGINIEDRLGNTLVSSGFGLLTSNINQWLDNNIANFDVEVKINPGTGAELELQEIELILKKSFLNNRLRINGNLGTPLGQQDNSDLKGDVNIEYDLQKDGKLKLRVFNKSFEAEASNKTEYRQGIGLFYRFDFDRIF
ncbi:MAG: translocation/assembly module TamB domain-containing protein [Flavobacteriales bacterium]|jgi:hypothetical protein|nr:translocation/assembly module TamB domain-containing protein [Flavobacteriales bacterium]